MTWLRHYENAWLLIFKTSLLWVLNLGQGWLVDLLLQHASFFEWDFYYSISPPILNSSLNEFYDQRWWKLTITGCSYFTIYRIKHSIITLCFPTKRALISSEIWNSAILIISLGDHVSLLLLVKWISSSLSNTHPDFTRDIKPFIVSFLLQPHPFSTLSTSFQDPFQLLLQEYGFYFLYTSFFIFCNNFLHTFVSSFALHTPKLSSEF